MRPSHVFRRPSDHGQQSRFRVVHHSTLQRMLVQYHPTLDDTGNGTDTLYDQVGTNNITLNHTVAADAWVANTTYSGVRAITCDGAGEGGTSGSNSGISGDAEFTLTCWLKADTLADYDSPWFLGDGTGALKAAGLVIMADGSFGISFGGVNDAHSAASQVSAGTWYFVAATKTAGAINSTTTIYLNGSSVALSGASTNTPNITDAIYRLGASVFGNFDGLIDDCRAYNYALTAGEITTLWNAERGGPSGTVPLRTMMGVGI